MMSFWRERFALSNTKHHRRLVWVIGALLFSIWCFVAAWSWRERSGILSSTELTLEQRAAAVQSQTRGIFNLAQTSLMAANHWISSHPRQDPVTDPDFARLIDKLRHGSGDMMEFRIVSRAGLIHYLSGNGYGNGNRDVRDREYFQAQLDPATRGFYVSRPVVSRVTGKWVVPISVPADAPQSDIAVLLVSIEFDKIAAAFESQRIQPSGTIGITRKDGTVLFRSPQDLKIIGRSIASGQAWRQFAATPSPRGIFESPDSLFDGQTRLVAFAPVVGYPLVVYVSDSKDDLLKPWRVQTVALTLVASLISVFGCAMGFALLRALTASRLAERIVQSTDEAIIGQQLDGVVTSWNPGAERMFGYTASEMLGNTLARLLPPDRAQEEPTILAKIGAGESVEAFETMRLRKDGGEVYASVSVSPLRDGLGHLFGASKIVRDITAQKAADDQLRLTASVFTNTSEGILITDREGHIVEVNNAFSRITGYDREDVLGQSPVMFRSSAQGPEVFRAVLRSLRKHGEWRGEFWNRRKDGEAYSAWLTVTKVLGANGKVRHYVVLFSDITVLKLQQEELEHGAHFDALTDLPNRLLLSDRLHQAMTMCLRHSQNLAVLYLDLDGFKAINDRFGHKAGDEVLVAVSARMRAALRDVDTLARMGGDEFVAVLSDVESPQDCIHLVQRVLDACSEPVTVQGLQLRVTASIGVTMFPQDSAEADQLMRHADQAMYEAKQSGKNRFHMFDSAQDAEVKIRSIQQERIAQGLADGEFVLYYQPKVNMRTGAILGAEALIRWQHPEKGLLAPGLFLPSIERHPLNEALGAWVMETALRQMDAWQSQGLVLTVSVNVAARQLQTACFAKQLEELLARYSHVDPACLELEVLETSALDDISSTASILQDCQRLGVRFAIDDFGTGYSSLTYLRHLPVEVLKIDQTFVRDMLHDNNDLSIVNGVIGLAAAFHREVIAEGVETIAHGKRLIELGCELGQGYEIARPMPAAQVAPWCASWRPAPDWTGAQPLIAQGASSKSQS